MDLENTNHRNRKQSKSPLIRQIGKSEFGNIRQEMILKKFFTDIEFSYSFKAIFEIFQDISFPRVGDVEGEGTVAYGETQTPNIENTVIFNLFI